MSSTEGPGMMALESPLVGNSVRHRPKVGCSGNAGSGGLSLSPSGRGNADPGGEDVAEVAGIGVADRIGYFGASLGGIAEQVFGPGEAERHEILVEGYAEGGGEQGGNVGGIQVHGRGEVVQLDRVRVMFMDVIQHPLDRSEE